MCNRRTILRVKFLNNTFENVCFNFDWSPVCIVLHLI